MSIRDRCDRCVPGPPQHRVSIHPPVAGGSSPGWDDREAAVYGFPCGHTSFRFSGLSVRVWGCRVVRQAEASVFKNLSNSFAGWLLRSAFPAAACGRVPRPPPPALGNVMTLTLSGSDSRAAQLAALPMRTSGGRAVPARPSVHPLSQPPWRVPVEA